MIVKSIPQEGPARIAPRLESALLCAVGLAHLNPSRGQVRYMVGHSDRVSNVTTCSGAIDAA